MDASLPRKTLLSCAEKFKTPAYVYDGNLIERQYDLLSDSFPYRPFRILYAMKANYNPAILSLLRKKGASIDAVSPGDVFLAKRVGFPHKDILFTANNITDEEMKQCRKEQVLFNIGSLSELERFGRAYPGSDVCLRFNSEVQAGSHASVRTGGPSTKFGILLKDAGRMQRIVRKHRLAVVGVHEHTGSGIPEEVKIVEGFQNLLSIVTKDRFPDLAFVDIGGGFKVPYHPSERAHDYHSIGREISRMITQVSREFGRSLELWIEPGRFIVAEAGFFLMRVVTIKKNASMTIVGTDGGFSQLIRPMLYGAYHHVSNLSNPQGKREVYDVTGNICETGDWFAKARNIPRVREGDILCVHTAGAYCYSMGSVYNLRPMPAEVLVRYGVPGLVRRRLDERQLVEQCFS